MFLLNAGVSSGEAMLERVALSNLRYATTNNLDSTREVLGLLYPLLQIVAPECAVTALLALQTLPDLVSGLLANYPRAIV